MTVFNYSHKPFKNKRPLSRDIKDADIEIAVMAENRALSCELSDKDELVNLAQFKVINKWGEYELS